MAENQEPVQADVQDVRADDDHHARNRAPDAFEKEARRHVEQYRRQSVSERRQHSAAAGGDVVGLAGCEQEPLPERACDRHHHAGDRRVRKGGTPDCAAAFGVAAADGLGGHHDGPHQQPDPDEQQWNLRRDGDRVPGEVVPGRMAAHRGVHGDDRQHPEPGQHDGRGKTHGLAQMCAQ